MRHHAAVVDDARPQQLAEAVLVQPVYVPRLIVRRAELGMKCAVPAEHDTSLIGVIKVSPLGQDSVSRIVDEQGCVRGIRLPYDPKIEWLDVFSHARKVPRRR